MLVLPQTHENLDYNLSSSLEEDTLMFYSLKAVEGVSSLYTYTMRVYTTQQDVDVPALLGTKICLKIKLTEGKKRYFTGFISQIKRINFQVDDKGIEYQFFDFYVRPKLWQTTLSQDCRIFQGKSALDIIEKLFEEHKITSFKNAVQSAGSTVKEYCVQYNETVYDFIARLLEEEGIFYYFEHSKDGETLILQDDSSSLDALSCESLRYHFMAQGEPYYESILSFKEKSALPPLKLATSDYSYDNPSSLLTDSLSLEEGLGENFYYPGFYQEKSDSEDVLKKHGQALNSLSNSLEIENRCIELLPGRTVEIKNLPIDSLNDTYLVIDVHHIYEPFKSPLGLYSNNSTLVLASKPYLPVKKYKKPRLFCPQSALVVGKEGEEIWTDDQGRICVHFYWDRLSEQNEKSSCWIRVMQPWAGNGWGVNFIPRIGMEVIVTFLDGDVDRPLVIGCVHNADNPSIYPDSKGTQSGIKTRSTKKKPDGHNELRFDDEKDSEQIYMHAQKNLDTEVENSRSLLIKKGDDTTIIETGNRSVMFFSKEGTITDDLTIEEGDRSITLNKGNHTLFVKKGDVTIEIETGDKKIILDKGDIHITLKEGNFLQTLEKGDIKIALDEGNYTQEIKGKRTITIKEDESCTNQEGFKREVTKDYQLKAKNITLDAQSDVTINAKNIKLNADNITLSGSQGVKIEASTGPFEVKALKAEVKADTTLDVKASAQGTLDLGASGTVKASGALTVNGGGALTLSGGMISIG